MNRTIKTAAIALLMAAGAGQAALAQEGRGDRGPRGGGGERPQGMQPGDSQRGFGGQDRGAGQDFGRSRNEAPAAPQAQVAPQAPRAATPREAWSRADLAQDLRRQRDAQNQAQARPRQDPRDGAQGFDRNAGDRDRDRDRDRGDRDDRNRDLDHQDWRNDWRNDGRYEGRGGGYAGQQWQRSRLPPIYQSPQRYRIGAYRPPLGFYIREWGFGDILPRTWFGPQYFIGNFDAFGLPWPPPGFEWVRVGEDALLIDSYTGRIVQVVRFLFW